MSHSRIAHRLQTENSVSEEVQLAQFLIQQKMPNLSATVTFKLLLVFVSLPTALASMQKRNDWPPEDEMNILLWMMVIGTFLIAIIAVAACIILLAGITLGCYKGITCCLEKYKSDNIVEVVNPTLSVEGEHRVLLPSSNSTSSIKDVRDKEEPDLENGKRSSYGL